MWQWLSTPPGSTSRPAASISFAARGKSSASATIRPPADADIAAEAVDRGDHDAIANYEIELEHLPHRKGISAPR